MWVNRPAPLRLEYEILSGLEIFWADYPKIPKPELGAFFGGRFPDPKPLFWGDYSGGEWSL